MNAKSFVPRRVIRRAEVKTFGTREKSAQNRKF
jgi:hypothetical protein